VAANTPNATTTATIPPEENAEAWAQAFRRPSTPLAAFLLLESRLKRIPSSSRLASASEWLGDLPTPLLQRSPTMDRWVSVSWAAWPFPTSWGRFRPP
jgi:hypothetical protein